MNLSVVIPLLNETESLDELYHWLIKVIRDHKWSYEIIFVDDGSTDDSWEVITELSEKDTSVKGIKFLKKLWKISSLECRLCKGKRRCGHHNGC